MRVLEVNALSAGYKLNAVIHGVHVVLDRGEIVTLVGANGAGKSTLVKAISGLVRPIAGSLMFDGEDISKLPPADRLKRGIAHVPEGRQIFGSMTVAENLRLGAYAVPSATTSRERFDEVCEFFPMLRPRLKQLAGNLSGGQQQLLAIARGLMSGPRLLLLDEPSLGVAPVLVSEIFALIKALRSRGIAIVMAEQNARQALMIADRGYVLENGKIVLTGTADDLLRSPDIVERYLGSSESYDVKPDSISVAEKLTAILAPDFGVAAGTKSDR